MEDTEGFEPVLRRGWVLKIAQHAQLVSRGHDTTG